MRFVHIRWPALLGILLVSIALAGCGSDRNGGNQPATSGPSDAAQQAEGGSTSNTAFNVVATEFAFALDAPQVSSGAITFNLKNEGDAPHDFAITGNGVEEKTALLQRGETDSITVELGPGTYTYICTVPGHAGLGMEGALTVN